LQRLARPLPAFSRADAGERQRKLNVGKHRLMRNQVIGLKNKSDGVIAVSVPVRVREALCRFVVDDQVPGAVMIQAADDIQKRRLSAAGMAEDSDELALSEFKIDALERMDKRIAGLVILFDLAEFEHGDFLP
jgi:hypothetical protein